MIFRRYEVDPVTLETVVVPLGFFRPMLVFVGLVGLIIAGWLLIGAFSTSPQERTLISENLALQEELSDSHNRVTNLVEQLEDLTETDRELYRVILQADTIPDDIWQMGVGGTDPYSRFDGFSISTAQLLRDHAELIDELERKIALQNISYDNLRRLGYKMQKKLEQLPTIQPAQGRLSSTFGIRLHPILNYRRMHAGVDISIPNNSPIYATGGGIVELVSSNAGYGKYIIIDHPDAGYKTLYGHLNAPLPHIKEGVKVVRGEQIALSGNTGLSVAPHVHYEVRDQNNHALNPISFFEPGMTIQEYQLLLNQAKRYRTLPSLD
ncbi:MAG: M23 family metallopeptidase [Bacteroidetes bacterium]|nr:M23 family metallopeptidase [Bacteroidota bacterium]